MRGVPVKVWAIAAALFVSAMMTAPLLPLFDPDEGYYPATAAESLDRGAFWDLRFNGAPRWDKPVLSYALIQGSFTAFGRTVTAARLPSALEAAVLVLVTGALVTRLAGATAGIACAAVLASMVGIQVFARVAHPEIGVVSAITTAELLFVLYLHTKTARRPLALVAGVVLGLGVLAKGPVALALPALAIVAALPFVRVERPRAMALDLAAAGTVALAVAAPWYFAMTGRHGAAFISEALWKHNVGRYAGELGHRSGALFLVVPTLVGLFPWTPLLAPACRGIDRRDRSPVGTLRVVMASALVTAFVFYAASASKLAHYALVFMPPAAVLIGLYLAPVLDGLGGDRRFEWRIVAGAVALVGLALAVMPWLVGTMLSARALLGGTPLNGVALRESLFLAVIPPALVLLAGAGLLWRFQDRRAVAATAGLGLALPMVIALSFLPLLRSTYPWQSIGGGIRGVFGPVLMVGPRAPSLTFFASQPVTRVTLEELTNRLTAGFDGWIITDRRWLHTVAADHRFSNVSLDVLRGETSMAAARVHRVASTSAHGEGH